MKSEINNENKAKFFAQYWGQDILCSDMYGDGGTIYSATMKDSSIKNEWIELKSLSDISDGDAEECGYDNAKYMLSDNYLINSPKVFDYLRSKGYLLPWMGLSCEELIEAGWAKYK